MNTRDYEDYVATAERISAAADQEPGSIGYMTLVHGRHQVVDAMLEHMKNAFQALDQKVLAAMVFSICLDPTRPHDVIETYTFTFSYRATAHGLVAVDSVSLNNFRGKVTFGDVKMSLNKTLVVLNQELMDKPHLPDKRFLHLRLLYNDDYDGTLNIPGFRTDSNGYRMANIVGWNRVNCSSASMVYDAGYKG